MIDFLIFGPTLRAFTQKNQKNQKIYQKISKKKFKGKRKHWSRDIFVLNMLNTSDFTPDFYFVPFLAPRFPTH